MNPTNLQQKRNASRRRPAGLTQQQAAVITIGRLLIPYRVNARPEQRAELIGMARMAAALGAITPDEHAHLLSLISTDAAPAAPEVH
nr:hypothetical protein [Halomonas socia]